MSWQPGRERIDELLVAGGLDRVTSNDVLARALIEDAGRHLHTAAAGISAGDLSGAYQLAYERCASLPPLCSQSKGYEPPAAVAEGWLVE